MAYTSKLAHMTVTPKKGKLGKLQLQYGCDLLKILDIIKELGFAPATHEDISHEIATGNNNIVIAVGSTVPHPKKSGVKAHLAFISGEKEPIHFAEGTNFTAFMEIAIKEKAA